MRLLAERGVGPAQFCNAGVGKSRQNCRAAWQSGTVSVVGGQWPVFNVATDAWGGSVPRAGLKLAHTVCENRTDVRDMQDRWQNCGIRAETGGLGADLWGEIAHE